MAVRQRRGLKHGPHLHTIQSATALMGKRFEEKNLQVASIKKNKITIKYIKGIVPGPGFGQQKQ